MKVIKLSESVTKEYMLFDADHKNYVYQYQTDYNYQKILHIHPVPAILAQIEYGRFTIDRAVELKNEFSKIAPIDIRIFVNGVELADNDAKGKILESLTLCEYRRQSSTSLRALTPQAIKAAKQEASLRQKVTGMMNSVQSNMSSFSSSKYKKLQSILADL